MSRPIITVTTDFGLSDSYVAQMKGVILEIAPEAILVDVTHQIPPQDCTIGSAILADVVKSFPIGAIHLVVVDPGVGTDRRPVAVEIRGTDEAAALRFVAPDNGVLTGVLRNRKLVRGVVPSEPRFFRSHVSSTFHGRDLFAPVAAHWSLGIDLSQFGPPLGVPLLQLPLNCPLRDGNFLRGQIVRTDSFGNLITNIDASDLPESIRDRLIIELGTQRIQGVSRCYGDHPRGDLLALIGSSGTLEIAVSCGHAGEILAVWSGDPVVVKGLNS